MSNTVSQNIIREIDRPSNLSATDVMSSTCDYARLRMLQIAGAGIPDHARSVRAMICNHCGRKFSTILECRCPACLSFDIARRQ